VFVCVRDKDSSYAVNLRRAITSDKLIICQMIRYDKTSIDACLQDIKSMLRGKEMIWGLVTNCGFPFVSKVDWGNFDSDLKQVIDSDVIGLLHLVRECLPFLRKNRGRIVNITSLNDRADSSAPFHCATSISNTTSHSMMECVRREMAFFGVNVINVQTEFGLQTLGLRDDMSRALNDSWQATDDSIRSESQLLRVRKELDDCTSIKNRDEALQSMGETVEHALRAPFPEFSYRTSSARIRPL
jgi:NAD(P)-dependent dehydrogenase (short-subunit alcohol dehydrogenase family)